MNIKAPNDEEEPDPIDPISMCPAKVTEKIQSKTQDLTFFLSQRAKTWEENIGEGQIDGNDFSTIALLERLAFYETMIDALLLRQTALEQRLGGTGDEKN